MYRERFRLLAAVWVCMALVLLGTERPAQAEPPETVEITFALEVWPLSPLWQDPQPELSDFVGEDTVLIWIDTLVNYGRLLTIDWSDCGPDFLGTWYDYAHGTIVNKGELTYATVCIKDLPKPPARYALVFNEIVDVQGCWLDLDGSGHYSAWATPGWGTTSAFFIVTGEFRVKQ